MGRAHYTGGRINSKGGSEILKIQNHPCAIRGGNRKAAAAVVVIIIP
jgi:hypothetical protein